MPQEGPRLGGTDGFRPLEGRSRSSRPSLASVAVVRIYTPSRTGTIGSSGLGNRRRDRCPGACPCHARASRAKLPATRDPGLDVCLVILHRLTLIASLVQHLDAVCLQPGGRAVKPRMAERRRPLRRDLSYNKHPVGVDSQPEWVSYVGRALMTLRELVGPLLLAVRSMTRTKSVPQAKSTASSSRPWAPNSVTH